MCRHQITIALKLVCHFGGREFGMCALIALDNVNSGKFAYVTNTGSNDVFVYAICAQAGWARSIAPSTPAWIELSPSRFCLKLLPTIQSACSGSNMKRAWGS